MVSCRLAFALAAKMQVDNKSLVKYDNPVLVSTTKDKKSTLKKVLSRLGIDVANMSASARNMPRFTDVPLATVCCGCHSQKIIR